LSNATNDSGLSFFKRLSLDLTLIICFEFISLVLLVGKFYGLLEILTIFLGLRISLIFKLAEFDFIGILKLCGSAELKTLEEEIILGSSTSTYFSVEFKLCLNWGPLSVWRNRPFTATGGRSLLSLTERWPARMLLFFSYRSFAAPLADLGLRRRYLHVIPFVNLNELNDFSLFSFRLLFICS
jgi:hypothetical protein